jgi:hypothetical protein
MNEKLKLASGAMLEMTLLSFEDGFQLFSIVSEELLKINIDLGNIKISELADRDMDNNFLNTLKNIVLSLIISKKLKDSLNSAFGRCLYNNLKIDSETFEDVNRRSDYLIVCWEVLRFNLSPFFPKSGLSFITNLGKSTENPS